MTTTKDVNVFGAFDDAACAAQHGDASEFNAMLKEMLQQAASDVGEITMEDYTVKLDQVKCSLNMVLNVLDKYDLFDCVSLIVVNYLVPLLRLSTPKDNIPLVRNLMDRGNGKELFLALSQEFSNSIRDKDYKLSCILFSYKMDILPRIKTKRPVEYIKGLVEEMKCLFESMGPDVFVPYTPRLSTYKVDQDDILYESILRTISQMVEFYMKTNHTISDKMQKEAMYQLLIDCLSSFLISITRVESLELAGVWAEENTPGLLAGREIHYYARLKQVENKLKLSTLQKWIKKAGIKDSDILISNEASFLLFCIKHWEEIKLNRVFLSKTEFSYILRNLGDLLTMTNLRPTTVHCILSLVRTHIPQILVDERMQMENSQTIIPFLCDLGEFSAICHIPSLRTFANDLYSNIISRLQDPISLQYIKMTLEHCEYDNLRAAALRELQKCYHRSKNETNTVFSSSIAWSSLRYIIYNTRCDTKLLLRNNIFTILQTLNLLIYLGTMDKDGKTGVRDDVGYRDRKFLDPLENRIKEWLESAGTKSERKAFHKQHLRKEDIVKERLVPEDDWNTGIIDESLALEEKNKQNPEIIEWEQVLFLVEMVRRTFV